MGKEPAGRETTETVVTTTAGEELAAVQSAGPVTADEIVPLLLPHLADAFRLSSALLRGDVHEAEDVVQAATGRAWQRSAQLRDREAARAWFLRIVANECRRRSRDRRRFVLTGLERLWPSRDPVASVDDADVVRSAVNALPERQRLPVVLHFALGYSVEDVAAITSAPVGTVKSRLSSATAKLRLRLATKGRPSDD